MDYKADYKAVLHIINVCSIPVFKKKKSHQNAEGISVFNIVGLLKPSV